MVERMRDRPALSGATLTALLTFASALLGLIGIWRGSQGPSYGEWVRALLGGSGLALGILAGAWTYAGVHDRARSPWGAAVLAMLAVASIGAVFFFASWSLASGLDDGVGLAVGSAVLAGLATGGALAFARPRDEAKDRATSGQAVGD